MCNITDSNPSRVHLLTLLMLYNSRIIFMTINIILQRHVDIKNEKEPFAVNDSRVMTRVMGFNPSCPVGGGVSPKIFSP